MSRQNKMGQQETISYYVLSYVCFIMHHIDAFNANVNKISYELHFAAIYTPLPLVLTEWVVLAMFWNLNCQFYYVNGLCLYITM